MPGNVDEAKWNQAKKLAAKEGHTDDYSYIMGIYKKLTNDGVSKKLTNDGVSKKAYNYNVGFEPIEIITKGIKKYLIKGYFSTIDEDLSTETVTMEGQKDILAQVKGRTITFDAEHEIFYGSDGKPLDKPTSNIPIAKVVDAELTDRGVLGTVEINSDSPRFKNVWESIKKGFLHSFSVAFYPLEAIKKKVNGVYKSFVNKLNLINITLTGAPMNPMAKFSPVMKNAVNGLLDSFDTYDANHNNEVNNMAEEQENVVSQKELKNSEESIAAKVDEVKVDEAKVETKSEVKEEEVKEDKIDFKSIVAGLKSEFTESLKASKDELDKALIEAKEGFDLELKSLKEKVEKLEAQPVKKAIKSDSSVMLGKDVTGLTNKSVFDLM